MISEREIYGSRDQLSQGVQYEGFYYVIFTTVKIVSNNDTELFQKVFISTIDS